MVCEKWSSQVADQGFTYTEIAGGQFSDSGIYTIMNMEKRKGFWKKDRFKNNSCLERAMVSAHLFFIWVSTVLYTIFAINHCQLYPTITDKKLKEPEDTKQFNKNTITVAHYWPCAAAATWPWSVDLWTGGRWGGRQWHVPSPCSWWRTSAFPADAVARWHLWGSTLPGGDASDRCRSVMI